MRTAAIVFFSLFALPIVALAQSATTQNPSERCKVLDTDIATKYVGGCQDNYANGYGFASGRDEYRGDFKNGLPHGYGTYSWGEQSKWATEEYQGWFYKGKKMGFGTQAISSNSDHPALEAMREVGILSLGRYYTSGIYKSGNLIHTCFTEKTCFEGLPKYYFDELNDFVDSKENRVSLSDLKRLTFLAIERQSGYSQKMKECMAGELIENFFGQIDGLPLDANLITKYQGYLRTQRLVTQVSLYCLE